MTGADLTRAIDEQLARGEHRDAWAALLRLVEERPSIATYEAIAPAIQRLDADAAGLTQVRVALLANFTAQPLASALAARALTSSLLARTWVAPVDQWMQEILDPASGLRERAPQVVVLALVPEALCPELVNEFLNLGSAAADRRCTEVIERIEQALSGIRAWSDAPVLVHDFAPPIAPALGILDPSHEDGQTAAFGRMRARLRAVTAAQRDVYLIDVLRLERLVGSAAWRDARMWTFARMPFAPPALQVLADEYLRFLRAFTGRVRKVLALDLDDTLWGGVLTEVGRDQIALGEEQAGSAFVELQRAVLELRRRGVVLAVNSKNDADEALDVLRTHPAMVLGPEHFSAIRINWQDKAANLVELAEELGLGLESFVFLDDSAAECERVRQALPEVLTIQLAGHPATWASRIRDLGVFDTLTYTEDDRERGDRYRAEAARTVLRRALPSIDGFYRSLDMELTIEPVTPATLARAAELTQRTNQFNLTATRYTADHLAAALAGSAAEAYVFRLKDRFGDHGIVAFAMLEASEAEATITSLHVSCRVLKRTVEDTILAFLVTRAAERGASEIVSEFRPTRRNGAAAGFYPQHGFAPVAAAGDGVERFRRATADPPPMSPWIRVIRPQPAPVL